MEKGGTGRRKNKGERKTVRRFKSLCEKGRELGKTRPGKGQVEERRENKGNIEGAYTT